MDGGFVLKVAERSRLSIDLKSEAKWTSLLQRFLSVWCAVLFWICYMADAFSLDWSKIALLPAGGIMAAIYQWMRQKGTAGRIAAGGIFVSLAVFSFAYSQVREQWALLMYQMENALADQGIIFHNILSEQVPSDGQSVWIYVCVLVLLALLTIVFTEIYRFRAIFIVVVGLVPALFMLRAGFKPEVDGVLFFLISCIFRMTPSFRGGTVETIFILIVFARYLLPEQICCL